ncbi:hypothetical protein [Streptomyces violascens]|uniref:Uncharacterized protein n=1 Tax=Streptomyces violascens TaxID=67381 RepID=A0ABQ3QTI3_9ACTN|nr:hypothetical protein [Streptomyces violascens]GHI40547.1 hypothetical protein Sviol_49550 [Streptomyces violascens]
MYATNRWGGNGWPDGAHTWALRSTVERPLYRTHETRRLSALCRETRDEVVAARAGKRIVTDLYALGIEPASSHLRAQAHAEGEGFSVGKRFSDPYGIPDPTQRAGWSQLCARISGGFAQGVVVVGQSDISTDPDEVEFTLRWLHAHCAFVDFVLAQLPVSTVTDH